MDTNLDYEKEIVVNNKLIKEYLYLIFSFDGKVQISVGDLDSFYNKSFLSYTTMLTNNKWYIIDSINSIDNYNKYKFSIIEGFQGKIENKLNIRIKKYNSYDIDYIKNNMPNLDEDYDEELKLEYDEFIIFKICENTCLNSKSILMRIDLNYNSDKSSIYKYNIEKIYENKPLEYKSYDINWYINYDFSPIKIQNQDTIFISTNHSNTIFPIDNIDYRKFESYNNGYLFISFPDNNLNDSQIKISYSFIEAKKEYDDDIGHIEIYKFDNKNINFETIIIDESIQNKLYSFELTKSIDKYFYIKIKANDYYILYDSEDEYSYLTIDKMPINIINFIENNKKDDITLMSYKNEYLIKLIYSRTTYSLTNVYIIKNEITRIFNLVEGDLRMITYSKKEGEIDIQINILEKEITDKTYINLIIPSKHIIGNLYISYLDNNYILNNTGINIYNTRKENPFIIRIKNNDIINENIPILIKLGFQANKIRPIFDYFNYDFDQYQYGIIKYTKDKNINMIFKTDLNRYTFNYYNCYLPLEYNNDTSNIINPELFNIININSKEYIFMKETNLNLERNIMKNNKLIKEYLYMIFCFNGRVKISTGDAETFYQKSLLSYSTILSNKKWYIIDSVNSIDNYNKYKLSIIEGFQGKIENKLNIRMKKYNTYNIDYIKNNMPNLDEDYDEELKLEYDEFIIFKICENTCLNSKSILMRIDLNYNSDKSSIYKYNIEKIYENKPLEYKSYDINWYINYDFSPIKIQNQDTIFISTNHSNTIFPIDNIDYRKFESYNNGYLFISFPDNNLNDSQIKISYSFIEAKKEYDDDIGHIEIYKFDNKNINFETIIIDESIQNKLYSFELTKSIDKYFYIKIKANDYYILYDSEDEYSYLTIDKMPINIINFIENNKKDDITLISYKNEYLMKLVYSRSTYCLSNIYIIKNEISRIFNLVEGDLRMITYSRKEGEISIQINILEKDITDKSYINLIIPSKYINGNMYISYSDNNYILNNTGINIYNIRKENQFIIQIKNNDINNENIPILIKLGFQTNKIKSISYNENYQFNKGQYGIIKYKDDKKINMKFKTDLSNLYFNYYTCYLSKDFTKDTTNIINPELFSTIKLNSKEYNFEIETQLDLEKINVKSNINNILKNNNDNITIESLYLVFSFDGKVQVSTGEKKQEDENSSTNVIAIVVPIVVVIVVALIIVGIFIYCRIKRKNNNSISTENEKLIDKNGSGSMGLSHINVENINDDKNNKKNINIEFSNVDSEGVKVV